MPATESQIAEYLTRYDELRLRFPQSSGYELLFMVSRESGFNTNVAYKHLKLADKLPYQIGERKNYVRVSKRKPYVKKGMSNIKINIHYTGEKPDGYTPQYKAAERLLERATRGFCS